jgi:hypothetical protein
MVSKGTRYSEEQMIRILKVVEMGTMVTEVFHKHGFAKQTLHWLLNKCGVNNATSYKLEERYYSETATSRNITGRNPGDWCCRVRVRNAGGASNWSGTRCMTVAGSTGNYKSFVPVVLGEW